MAIPPSATPLARRLADEIAATGPMTFERFMGRCLYDPIDGYYVHATRAIGREGDFYTSVSVGPVFGQLVASFVAGCWREMNCPGQFTLLEAGGHDGRLMADVLAALREEEPDLLRAVEPILVEPLPARRRVQEERLGSLTLARPVRWILELDELAASPVPGVVLANELLDAFPVARFRLESGVWHELGVGLGPDGCFRWESMAGDSKTPPHPAERLLPLSRSLELAPGYITEVCPALAPWFASLSNALRHGRGLIVDYGLEGADYFSPHRRDGTLRGYRSHRRCDDPFAAPGETDLTADVNLTHVADAARAAGFRVLPPRRQGEFLTSLAEPRLLASPPPSPAWRRQFQTLVHPSHLGHRFYAVVIEK